MEDAEDDMQDVEGGSDSEKVDSSLIKRILSQMKSEFNKPGCSIFDSTKEEEEEEERPKVQVRLIEESEEEEDQEVATEEENEEENHAGEEEEEEEEEKHENNEEEEDEEEVPEEEENDVEKPEIEEAEMKEEEEEEETQVDCKKEPEADDEPPPKEEEEEPEEKQEEEKPEEEPEEEEEEPKTTWRTRRTRSGGKEQLELKRSSRRMSKDLPESVLQSAIILKEKSFGKLNENKKRKRRSRREIEAEKPPSPPPKPVKTIQTRYSEPIENSTVTKVAPLKMKRLSVESGSEEASTSKKELKLYIKSSDKVVENDIFGKNCGKLILCHSDSNSRDSPTLLRPPMETNALAGLKRKLQLEDNPPPEPAEHEKRLRPYYVVQDAVEASEPPQVDEIVMEGASCLCDCQKDWGLYPSQDSMTSSSFHCRALDSFDERVIGCANPVDQNSPFLRPGKTIPHSLLCQIHVQRLIRHNSCPSCGLFCTQGEFMQCAQKHQFHKQCHSSSCPHCGTEDIHRVKISLGEHRCPVFLPKPNTPALRTARMTFSKGVPKNVDEDFTEESVDPTITLPSGGVISSRGIPLLEKEKLDKILQSYSSSPPSNETSQRYTWRTAYQAAKLGDSEKLLQILGSGFSPSMMSKEGTSSSPIHAAAMNGHLGVLHILAQVGVNLNLRDKEQLTPLMTATLAKQNEVVKYLVKAGAQPTLKGVDGMTALHIAAKDGNLVACHYLVSNMSCPEDFINTVDEGRWTALVWAAENSHDHVVRFLLERNADPQIRDRERNIALHWAAYSGSSDVVEFLLNYGSGINLTNAKGDTPLHIAARQAADECVFLLLARGARTDMMNKDGHLPRDVVVSKESYSYAAIDLNMKLKQAISNSEPAPRVVCADITKGYEPNPIQCVNGVDDDGAPEDFVYVPENCITTKISIDRRISNLTSCKCEDDCSSTLCMCGKVSIRSWYDAQGKLLPEFNFEDPPMIFECNPTCKCTLSGCRNRVVQRGIKARLQLFKTKDKNWGVHSLTRIPKGSYVCEYVGEIISDSEADTREDDSYLFDLDSRDGESYCIDARKYGNITRFINHSCSPNLLPVRVFIEHQDLHFPRIAFFANRDILPYEELSFDYGEKFWIIKYKAFTCKCGVKTCKYSDETIQETLEKYREKALKEEQEEDEGDEGGLTF